ncbi:UNVERIFIED_CONTAM: putative disease resistance protein RXW24L [Sesamum radiatum]|uniref:Disease resistance protein RXW24L n=1 Tax=Sesamum radiatum TaxID=300843 RepID=A0AAW2S897_SESRA
MKGTGTEIVGRCQGSPLAVAVMGASLQKSNLGEWQRVLNALESIEEELGPEEKVERILALSYNRLPHYLKPCFLYLGHFPEEYDGIQVEKLYLLLMAEGKEEEFFKIADPGNGNTADLSRTPRLAIHLNKYEKGGSSHIDKANVRSLLVFDTRDFQPKSSWPQEFSDLKDFKILRILHFDGVDFRAYELPKGMEKLAYLRYLSFQGCYLDKLPTVISSLLYLEILDLRVRRRMIVPNVLSKMKRLSHLYFPVVFAREGQEKLSLDGLIKLEVLENFDTEMCNSKDLPKLEKLRILRVIAQGNEEDLDMIIKCMETNSSELQLSFLDIRKFDCYSSERLSVLKLLLSCQTLDVVHIEGHIGKLPEELKISENFMQIVLNGSELKEDPMPILGALPNLRSLVLSNDAYEGKEMKCSASDFPELRSLKLLNLHYLETWNVDERSMQNLSTLAIEKCSKLKMLPAGLKFAKNLKEVKLASMSTDFVDSINGQLHGEGEDCVSRSRQGEDSVSGSRRTRMIVLEN